MAVPANILEQVTTYQMADLALLLNSSPTIKLANKKFDGFENMTANLGDSVSFDLPVRYVTNSSLIATFQATEQRKQTLTVDQAENVAVAFTAQQFIFNVEEYMDRIGRSAVAELAYSVESNVNQNFINHTYRFFGDGVTKINSYDQFALALAFFRNYGFAKNKVRGIMSDIAQAETVATGLNQFALDRNNEDANSWEVGNFSNCDWYTSNLLAEHIAGTAGQNGTTLTFSSINAAGTQITFTGAGAGETVVEGDLFEFDTDIRYRTFIGHKPSANTVQFRATANATEAGGNLVVDIFPALISAAGPNQNLSRALAGTDTGKFLPSHRAGIIYSGDALYLAMPRLPEEVPFPTSNMLDEETGAAMRMYYGSKFGENEHGLVHDVIWGSTLVDEYAMRLVFPLTQ